MNESVEQMTTFQSVMQDVMKERQRQDVIWGESNHEDRDWLPILTEEVGELSKAMLHSRCGGRRANTESRELIEIAAVAVAWLECKRRNEARIASARKETDDAKQE